MPDIFSVPVTEPLECPEHPVNITNRSGVKFYIVAIPRFFSQLLLSSEIGPFENEGSAKLGICCVAYHGPRIAYVRKRLAVSTEILKNHKRNTTRSGISRGG